MRLPLDHDGGTPSSMVQSHVTSLVTSPAWLSTFVALKTLFQQQQQLHHFEKRTVVLDNKSNDIADLVLCIISVLGSLSIIIPYCLTKHSRKLRHSLILGLATSDLASSLVIISTTAYSLNGGNLTTAVRFCGFSGYAFQVTICTQVLWNLSIAIITYMILVHPLSTFNVKVERHLIWLWPIFWGVCLLFNGIGWIVTGYGNVGGYCNFAADKGGAYFAAIFVFVPRAIVVIIVVVLYTHLFFFLRRVNMFNKATSQSRQLSSSGRSGDSNRLRLHGQEVSLLRGGATTTTQDEKPSSMATKSYPGSRLFYWTKWRSSQSQSSSLPLGDESIRANSSSSQGKSSLGGPKPGEKELDTLEMVDYSGISPKSNPTEIPASPQSPKQSQPLTPLVPPTTRSPPTAKRPHTARAHGSERSLLNSRRTSLVQAQYGFRAHNSELEEGNEGSMHDLIDALQPMALRRDVRDFEMTSAPREHLKHYSLSPAGIDMLKKANDISNTENKDDQETTNVPSYEAMLGQDWTWGMAVGGTAEQSNFSPPTSPSKNRFRSRVTLRNSNADHGTGTGTSSSTDEHGVESLGSTLNRQASILLLLYPAAYVLLFSISIVRIIVDISSPDGSAQAKAARSSNLLHAISRWTIFAQGAIDAIVFQLVERSFRQRMKRRRRIAAGENLPDFWTDAVIKKISNLFRRST